jgi:hypothetical protein
MTQSLPQEDILQVSFSLILQDNNIHLFEGPSGSHHISGQMTEDDGDYWGGLPDDVTEHRRSDGNSSDASNHSKQQIRMTEKAR